MLLLRGPDEVLLLDEPDNFLDVPGKRWLEERLAESPKSVLYVTHDRWFTRGFDRFLLFAGDGEVRETPEPVWEPQELTRAM